MGPHICTKGCLLVGILVGLLVDYQFFYITRNHKQTSLYFNGTTNIAYHSLEGLFWLQPTMWYTGK